jgi:hypothetical protein
MFPSNTKLHGKMLIDRKFNGLNFSLTAKVKGFFFSRPIDVTFTLGQSLIKFQFKIHFSSRDINYLCLKCLCKKKRRERLQFEFLFYRIEKLIWYHLFSNI